MRIDVKGVIVSDGDAWVYDYFGEPYTSPGKVGAVLDEADGEDIDVYINSGGGSVFAGSEIYSSLRAYPGNVTIHVTGIAASAASVIAMAAKSDISPTAELMVHRASSIAIGNHHDMDSESRILQAADRAIAAAYTEKSGMSEQEALDLMDVETWLPGKDAVKYGLIDALAEPKNANADGRTPADDERADRLVAAAADMLPASVIDKMNDKRRSLIEFFAN